MEERGGVSWVHRRKQGGISERGSGASDDGGDEGE